MTLVAIAGMLAALTACGSGGSPDATAGSPAPAAVPAALLKPIPAPPGGDCPAVVLATLGRVLQRIYDEGVVSEEVLAARDLIKRNAPLHEAVEHGDSSAAHAAAARLLATKHMTDLLVERHGRVLASVGEAAIAPLQGNLTDANGKQIGSYLTTLFSDHTFVSEAKGITQGQVAVRAGGEVRAGNATLGGRELHGVGELSSGGVQYEYVAFPVQAFPAGTATVEVFRTRRSLPPLCGASREATVAKTLQGVAMLIYKGESGPRARLQVKRVQAYKPLQEAVAARDPEAARKAIDVLLHKHVVRLRVSTQGALLADVGGPYVLAPLRAPLTQNGRQIGELELSIQDDEGYKRLAERLAGRARRDEHGRARGQEQPRRGQRPDPAERPVHLPGAQLHRVHDPGRSLPLGPPDDQGPGPEPVPVGAGPPPQAACMCRAGTCRAPPPSKPAR